MRKYGKANTAARMDDKGFYIILTICALAILVSGYVLFFIPSGSSDPVMDDTSSLPVTVPVTTPQLDLTEDEPLTDAANPAEDNGKTDEKADTSDAADPADMSADTMDEAEPAPSMAESGPEPEEAVQTAAEQPAPVWVRPVEGAIMIPFSGEELVFQSTFGDWRVHTGTDYAGAEGDRVYAVTDGIVDRVWMDGLYGQCVQLSHADGLVTVYMGLKEDPKVKEGSTVKAGDVIGELGSTNAAESALGAHLHLEARVGDRPVDVETFLTGTEGE